MGYKVTITYEIEVTSFGKEQDMKLVEKDLQARAETSVGYGLPHFWRVRAGSVKVKARKS
jgi:hypothetical protein